MKELEYPPLHPEGIKDIDEEQLYPVFVQPFGRGQAHDYRQNLLIQFGQFINQFKRLGLKAELWIDGSFCTRAPDPSDVDLVFFFDLIAIDQLEGDKRDLFERLFTNRKFMKAQYRVEVFYEANSDLLAYQKWQRDFGTCYDDVTPKGIFRIYFN
ncbi:hypothetical protein LX87_05541 [Larkinella arboricola]|uniref:Nucleotidyltransferase-like protein n=1 Tax=Larkinella arboricola TaxID=643671 RepID=A0A327WJL3_LARAB|nr:hypothetical protein [Larkinella arboricola]RAJ90062.1 hypothetical protein LX87_05541 [Larkinella arboricola]